jgi:PDZ domain-containing protein
VAALGFIPTPYWIMAPGSALDLSQAVAVEGHAPGADRFYMTDVTVQRATALTLPLGLMPGVQLVREDNLIPRGVPAVVYDRVLSDAMDDSESAAAIVAERAAGLRVADPPKHMYVGAVLPSSGAATILRPGDEILKIDGLTIDSPARVSSVVARLAPWTTVPITVRRGGDVRTLDVRTTRIDGAVRLGIALEARSERPDLPVPVHFNVGAISGSSGGLMLALAVYGALRGDRGRAGESIAGTGTIAADGSVGPIEGTRQKLIAAKRAGVRVFLVPRENAADIASEREVRVVPVGTFSDALAALRT